MNVAFNFSDRERHPFGGCGRLLEQYQTVGAALLGVERNIGGVRSLLDPLISAVNLMSGGVSFSKIVISNFQEHVVTVSLEVLESYLDDLLDIDVPEANLFIARKYPGLVPSLVSILGMGLAISFGMYCVAHGAKFEIALLLTIFAALPFAVVWHFAPRERVARRMRFAKLVALEVQRRRGGPGATIKVSHRLAIGAAGNNRASWSLN